MCVCQCRYHQPSINGSVVGGGATARVVVVVVVVVVVPVYVPRVAYQALLFPLRAPSSVPNLGEYKKN